MMEIEQLLEDSYLDRRPIIVSAETPDCCTEIRELIFKVFGEDVASSLYSTGHPYSDSCIHMPKLALLPDKHAMGLIYNGSKSLHSVACVDEAKFDSFFKTLRKKTISVGEYVPNNSSSPTMAIYVGSSSSRKSEDQILFENNVPIAFKQSSPALLIASHYSADFDLHDAHQKSVKSRLG